ncbi:YkgJ family cysteine cluster protein [Luteibacter sp.]|uniref:YkgJ family cysteine cluster protein n=1 Tax=Luteibacter sp. TaxID=1886636 RepID=UPI003F804F19
MPLHFSCTMCGRCCHGLRLPLSLDEARRWLDDGGEVEVFCEAVPWPEEPAADNGPAWHKRKRSFLARSGQLPVRVVVTLVASFDGACPNLRADMGCGIYERRPTACRVYPAEVNPFIDVDPALKLCPPEAWQTPEVLRADDGSWADPVVAAAVVRRREDDYVEADAKHELCNLLGIHEAGLANEGMLAHTPGRERMREVLQAMAVPSNYAAPESDWILVSHRLRTMWLLESAGARGLQAADLEGAGRRFVSFVGDE